KKSLALLLGKNGGGKSTLLNLISGLEQADQGEMPYVGQKLSKQQLQENIGYVPQAIALFEHMTVNENINCFKALCKRSISDDLIMKYIKQLNLKDLHVTVSNLSG